MQINGKITHTEELRLWKMYYSKWYTDESQYNLY